MKNGIKPFKFIHISKTGGETIDVLLNLDKDHTMAKDVLNIGNYYSFCFVRNPYTRLYSWYHHLRKHLNFPELTKRTNNLNNKSICYNMLKSGMKLGPVEHRELAEKLNFNDWVKIILTDKKYLEPWWGPCGKQCDYIYDCNGRQLVNDVYKFENYTSNLRTVLIKIGRSDLISQINITNYNCYPQKCEDAYTNETKKLVYEYFKSDFTLFGYTM